MSSGLLMLELGGRGFSQGQDAWSWGCGGGPPTELAGDLSFRGQRSLVTYPLDTAGMGLPVLEFKLKAPILWREKKRECGSQHSILAHSVLGSGLGDNHLVGGQMVEQMLMGVSP